LRLGEALEHPTTAQARVTNWMPRGWLKVCHSISFVEHLEPEVRREVGLASAVERQRHAQPLDLGPERS